MIAKDPIFAALAKHKACVNQDVAAATRAAGIPRTDKKAYKKAEAKAARASAAQLKALRDLLRTPPTTLTGAASVLEYVNRPDAFDNPSGTLLSVAIEYDEAEATRFLPRLAKVLRRMDNARRHARS